MSKEYFGGYEAMKLGHGSWVAGENFFDRKAEMELFLQDLRDGANLLLIAQRRMGKTSIMRECSNRIAKSHTCLHVDLEACNTPEDAIVALSRVVREDASLWKRTRHAFGDWFDRLEKIDISEFGITLRSRLSELDWREQGTELLNSLDNEEKPLILFLDEVPILINRILRGSEFTITRARIHEADTFLSWLREMRAVKKGRIQQVITGSIGLQPLLQRVDLSGLINDLKPFELAPWPTQIAADCIQELSANYNLNIPQDVAQLMADRLGCCIPHHVQMFFDHIQRHCVLRGAQTATVEAVNEVYDSTMTGIRGHAELSHMEERLKAAFGPDSHQLALDLLTETAVTKSLTSNAIEILFHEHSFDKDISRQELRNILGTLEHDGYLRRNGDSYEFQSTLLADWWSHRFNFHYVIAADRTS